MTLINVPGFGNLDIEETLKALDRADCEDSLYTFLQYSWRWIDASPFVPGWPIEAVAEHLQAIADGDIRRLIINIPPRCAKPVRHDALITTREDGLIPLADVRVGHHVLTHMGRFRRVLNVHRQGILPTYKLTTRRGRVTYAAGDHPYLTPDGWRELRTIEADDVVATVPCYAECGRPTVSIEEARLLGYLIGDGQCRSTPNITVADDIEAADIHHVIQACGFASNEKSYKFTKKNAIKLRRITIKSAIKFTNERYKKGFRGPVLQFLDKHKIANGNSYTKMIPDAIMQGNNDIVAAYLGAYWACDGYVTTKGAKRDGTQRTDMVIGCDSVNYKMLRQVQTLLLRLGITSNIRTKIANIKTEKQGDKYTSYSLSLAKQDDCWRFACAIKIPHEKGRKLEEVKKRRFDFDHVLIGDVVNSVEPDSDAECLCLTVDEDASFVADGFAVHNSSITSVAFPAWVWAQRFTSPTSGPGVQFLHASYAQQLSLRDSVKCRRLIESPWYQSLWGDKFKLVGDQNTKTRFDNDKKGSRLSTSVGSALTGEGGSIIVVDDPNAAQEAFSEATIHSTIEWWDSALSTRLNDPKTGAFVVIQQRLSEEDLTGHILSKDVGDWTHLCLPMRYEPERSFVTSIGWKDPRSEPGELLWEERFGESEVKLLERQLGPWAAAGQLQQRPEPKGGGVIKREWWNLWNEDIYPPLEYIIASIDTAYTMKTENDFSAMTVWGIFSGDVVAQDLKGAERTYSQRNPCAMLMNAWQERLELHELVMKVAETCKRMKVDKLLIENKASGYSVAQEIRRLFGHEDWAVQLIDPKGQDKLARLYSVQHLFAEGMIYAPDKSWADTVITQVSTFPKGKHDDLVDTVSQSLRHLRELGLLQRGPELTAQVNESMQFRGNAGLPPIYPV